MTNQFAEIPDTFWGLFRSGNRQIYIEALLQINEEYQYSNYYLSREVCIRTLSDYFARRNVELTQDEWEDDFDLLEPQSIRILNWLLRTGWLRKVNDYMEMTVNIVIPDYAAVFVDAFARLAGEDEDETQVYIQNIYGLVFAFLNDPRANLSLLKTAVVNTRRLNKTLQDMLHNMDRFFGELLDKQRYGDVLEEHLRGYVEEIVQKKYHILKTSDNFYLYKTDIKRWIAQMRRDEAWLEEVCRKNRRLRGIEVTAEDIEEQLDLIERGFDDIEHRIANLDKEHTRYIRATVTRIHYLLNREDSMKGLVIRILSHLSEAEEKGVLDEDLAQVAKRLNVSQFTVISDRSLYRRRRPREDFVRGMAREEEQEELSREDILRMNKIKNCYSRKEIEDFILERMKEGRLEAAEDTVQGDEDFEKLILAYDDAMRKDSPYRVTVREDGEIDNGSYRYPRLTFELRSKRKGIQEKEDKE